MTYSSEHFKADDSGFCVGEHVVHNEEFTIIGGGDYASRLLAKAFLEVVPASIAGVYGVDYEELRQLFICDPRVGASHTIVFEDAPFYQSKCFDKDVPAIIEASRTRGYMPAFLASVVKTNDRFRNGHE